MTDIFTPEKRSWVIPRIRGTNIKIDIRMKNLLQENKIKFEMYPKMFGNHDFVITKKKIIIFCDGNFWHGYKYHEKKKLPTKYWRDKIETNMKRDRRITRKLRRDGYSVLRFWEHDIEKRTDVCINGILRKISEK